MVEKNIYIKNKKGTRLFVNVLEVSVDAPNVIYVQTPVGSVCDLKECYAPLSKHGLNVFALDLTSIGRSEGNVEDFTAEAIIEDLNACVAYIQAQYTNAIHLFGGTGTGGVLGQYYVSATQTIKSFVQYGAANYQDPSPLGNPTLVKGLYPLVSLLAKWKPQRTFSAKPPTYNGVSAEKENQWYRDHADNMKMSVQLVKTILDIVMHEESALKNKPECPVLLFTAKHDRYYATAYTNKYCEWLNEPKSHHMFDDSHLSFLWHAEEICQKASEWFHQYS